MNTNDCGLQSTHDIKLKFSYFHCAQLRAMLTVAEL